MERARRGVWQLIPRGKSDKMDAKPSAIMEAEAVRRISRTAIAAWNERFITARYKLLSENFAMLRAMDEIQGSLLRRRDRRFSDALLLDAIQAPCFEEFHCDN